MTSRFRFGACALALTCLLAACGEARRPEPQRSEPAPAHASSRPPSPPVTSPVAPGAPAAKRASRYELVYTTYDSAVLELRVNGALVLGANDASNAIGRERISQWLRAGRNVVRARVTPPEPGPSHPPGEAPKIEIAVERFLPETRVAEPLAALNWPEGQGAGALPADLELVFTVDRDVPGCALFAEAEPLADTPATRTEVVAFARELHAAYGKRDLPALEALREYRTTDEDRCYGRAASAEASKRAFASFAEEARAQRRWRIAPLAIAPQLELVPELKLYRVSRDGEPLIHVEQDDGIKSYAEVFVARIAGRWTWVR